MSSGLGAYFHDVRKRMNIKGGFQHEWSLGYNCHEIAHWLIADEDRRDKCCFGLLRVYRVSPDGFRGSGHHDCELRVTPDRAEFEELLASLLGISLVSLIDVKLAWVTLIEENWLCDWDEEDWMSWDNKHNTPPIKEIEQLRSRDLWPPKKHSKHSKRRCVMPTCEKCNDECPGCTKNYPDEPDCFSCLGSRYGGICLHDCCGFCAGNHDIRVGDRVAIQGSAFLGTVVEYNAELDGWGVKLDQRPSEDAITWFYLKELRVLHGQEDPPDADKLFVCAHCTANFVPRGYLSYGVLTEGGRTLIFCSEECMQADPISRLPSPPNPATKVGHAANANGMELIEQGTWGWWAVQNNRIMAMLDNKKIEELSVMSRLDLHIYFKGVRDSAAEHWHEQMSLALNMYESMREEKKKLHAENAKLGMRVKLLELERGQGAVQDAPPPRPQITYSEED